MLFVLFVSFGLKGDKNGGKEDEVDEEAGEREEDENEDEDEEEDDLDDDEKYGTEANEDIFCCFFVYVNVEMSLIKPF
jgi:hypothetical protein